MRTLIALLIAAGVGFAAGYVMVSKRLHARYAAELARQQAAWQTEKETWLPDPRPAMPVPAPPAHREATVAETAPAPGAAQPSVLPSAPEILERLKAVKIEAGPAGLQGQREVVRLLDDLARCGPAALPAIRAYLAGDTDVNLSPGKGKGKGPPAARDGLLPSSLRAGLFNVLREIGGPEAEQILAETAGRTSRSDEVLTVARLLEQMAPGKYRDTLLAAVKTQFTGMTTEGADPGAAGRRDAGPLFEVLRLYGDRSFVDQARSMLFESDGKLNKDALDYLQAALHQENLPLLQQLLQSPQFTDPKQREEAVRLVAELAGTDPQANQLWYDAALDAGLSGKARERAIAELEKRGFQNRDQPTDYDRQLAVARLQLLDTLAPQLQDPAQLAALEKTRAKLAEIVDPGLKAAAPPKAPKAPKPGKP
mgnify:CR=1 FL=1